VHGFEEQGHGRIGIEALASGARVRITVSDNGIGIPPDSLGRIFDPFFTTRMGRGGIGLGLHVAHNLVVGVLGGRITATSGGSCTIFTLDLPLTAPQADRPKIGAMAPLELRPLPQQGG
jgi:two-component system NtrC family sensor kinase